MSLKTLGIFREPEYSPGRHTSNDVLILRLVGQALDRAGIEVHLASLAEARSVRQHATVLFSMCQGAQALAELASWKEQGACIINDPIASRRTYRDTLCITLHESGVPFPRSVFVPTERSSDLERHRRFFQKGGAWLKRSDVHATQPEDVVRVAQWEDLAAALERFQKRGLQSAILQEHCAGDEVKFYAVSGGRFFWPYYPKDCQGYPFDENVLKKIAEQAARVLGLDIYGGDAIIAPDGTVTLIDVNDWPSFAPCRGAAAHAIAQFLKDQFHAIQNRRETTAVSS